MCNVIAFEINYYINAAEARRAVASLACHAIVGPPS